VKVLTIGESMALLDAPASGRLGASLPVGMGDAEANVAIGLARLGVDSTWASRVGDDALGTFLVREIRAEGVRVLATRDPAAPTGLMLKEHRNGRPWRVRYYRSGSAASRLSPADVDAVADEIAAAGVLHLTGITAALGRAPLAAVEHAIQVAKAAGTLVSFDVNHRATLWSDEEAAPVLARLVAAADLVFAGPEEAALVLERTPAPASVEEGEALARELAKRGPGTGVV
jgi:2-dehydro-3-deoxygluconokinase